MKASDSFSLIFFRYSPSNVGSTPGLLSSLQDFETSLFLLGLGRFPHALTTSASALESCLLAGGVGGERDVLSARLRAASARSPEVREIDVAVGQLFRDTRNRIVHRGFSSLDDSLSVTLFLTASLPLLTSSYKAFHGFDLRYSLLPELADHLAVAADAHALAVEHRHDDVVFCLSSFAQLLRYAQKPNFATAWELQSITTAEEIGIAFEHKIKERSALQSALDPYWELDCPVCEEPEAVVCELDLGSVPIIAKRAGCANCGFLIVEGEELLSRVLFARQLAREEARIAREYGLKRE